MNATASLLGLEGIREREADKPGAKASANRAVPNCCIKNNAMRKTYGFLVVRRTNDHGLFNLPPILG